MNYIETAEKAARAAGQLLLEKLGRVTVKEKSRANLVTEADVAAQNLICSIIQEKFAEHCFLGEEAIDSSQQEPNKRTAMRIIDSVQKLIAENLYCWIVDPLDGTTNYVHNYPFFCSSVALYKGRSPICGVIFNPCSGECFTAEKGNGAFLNGKRIHVSNTVEPIKAVASIGFPTNCQLDSPDVTAFLKAIPHTQAIRRTGSASLNMAFLAAGRTDAMWCHAINVWDLAAGLLLIDEAGGVITAIDGSPFLLDPPSFIAAATKELHKKYLDIFSVDLL